MSYIHHDPRAASTMARASAAEQLCAARLRLLARDTHRTANVATAVFCALCFAGAVLLFMVAL